MPTWSDEVAFRCGHHQVLALLKGSNRVNVIEYIVCSFTLVQKRISWRDRYPLSHAIDTHTS